ncbi:hypothetical protein CRV24_000870 [Beauveria bassiana]|nr:hypothetical protein CRV24_000870 [Beauveria bassiana]KAH8720571.1 hypothetical protein HC256_000962 [Beauveria bassiana]
MNAANFCPVFDFPGGDFRRAIYTPFLLGAMTACAFGNRGPGGAITMSSTTWYEFGWFKAAKQQLGKKIKAVKLPVEDSQGLARHTKGF